MRDTELPLVESYCSRSPSFPTVVQNTNEQICCLGWPTGTEKLAASNSGNSPATIWLPGGELCYT